MSLILNLNYYQTAKLYKFEEGGKMLCIVLITLILHLMVKRPLDYDYISSLRLKSHFMIFIIDGKANQMFLYLLIMHNGSKTLLS